MTLQEYLQGLAKVVSELVGDKLSVAKGSNPIPSVFIERQKPPKPFYPYSTTDYIGKGKYGARELYSAFNEDTNSNEHFFNRRLRLRVSFYGKYGDNILDTAEFLEMKLKTEEGQQVLDKYMPRAGLMQTSDPSYNDNLLNTDYEEFCFLSLDFWIISVLSDTEFYHITDINVDGRLYEDFEQQEPPLTIPSD